MKSKDLQQVVFRKYEDGDSLTKIFRDLNGSLGLATIKRWCKMIRETGSIHHRVVHVLLEPVKRLKKSSTNSINRWYQFGVWLRTTTASTHRILKDNLKLCAYKMRIEPKLTKEHQNKRKKIR